MELDNHLHLAYADQRDGHRTQHWWRLFFDEQSREQKETATKNSSLTVGKSPDNNRSSVGNNAYRTHLVSSQRSKINGKCHTQVV